jgi:cell wall assembly regulator SMI1
MTVATAMTRLRELAAAFAEPERPAFRPAASAMALQALERAAGARLPEPLKEFLLQADAVVAMDIHNGYWLGGAEELARSMERGDPPRSVTDTPVIPVATDGGGNAFLLSVSDGRVWRWDHETGQVQVIAGSFPDFLDRVADDWEQFALGTPDWRFLV